MTMTMGAPHKMPCRDDFNSANDALTETFRQLFKLDASDQQKAIEALSSNAPASAFAPPPGVKTPEPRCLDASTEQPAQFAQDASYSPDAKAFPKPPPRGLKAERRGAATTAVASVNASQQSEIQAAAKELQSAIANWEAATSHLRTEDKHKAKGQRTSGLLMPTVQEEPCEDPSPSPPASVGGPSKPAPSIEELYHIVGGLLNAAKEQPGSASVSPGDASAMLRRCLETQQAKSVQKIKGMVAPQPPKPQPAAPQAFHANDFAPHAAAAGWRPAAAGWPGAAAGWPAGAGWGMPAQMPPMPNPMWAVQAQSQAHLRAYGSCPWLSLSAEACQNAAIASLEPEAAPAPAVHRARPRNAGRSQGGTRGGVQRERQAAAKDQQPGAEEEETLRTHLRDLQKMDPRRVLIVRKINRIGFKSPGVLQAHYSKYGPVEQVRVSHSYVKSTNRRFAARLRPSGLGFIVMTNVDDVEAILREGEEQQVEGSTIKVQRFEQRTIDDAIGSSGGGSPDEAEA